MTKPDTLRSLHRPLGTTGIAVSPISFGTVKLGRNQQVKYPTPFDLPSDEDVVRLLQTARECAINLIDTAPAYGLAEERLGKLLPGPRDDWVITTKAGEEFTPGDDGGRSHFDFSGDAVARSVHRSLERLRTDVLDAVLLHSDGSDLQIIDDGGGIEALADLKQQGHIRAFGISTKTVEGALRAIETCDIVMLAYNPGYTVELPAIHAAADAGVGVLLKKVLSSGHVGDHDPERHLTPDDCIRDALSLRGVSSVIVGTINPDHLRANAESAAVALANPAGDNP